MTLLPLRTFRQTSNRIYKTEGHEPSLLVKEYVGPGSQRRRSQERDILELWSRHGFRVPALHDLVITELGRAPYLATEYLDHPTLQQQLRSPSLSRTEKIQLLETIFRENHLRHRKALELNEPRLVHYDPNTSNILCGNSTFCHIDFEHQANQAPLPLSVSLEIAKFTRWAARDIGGEALQEILPVLLVVYEDQRFLLESVADRTLARPFQFFHRWRDRRRKQKKPDEVTKYDVAGGLKKLLT